MSPTRTLLASAVIAIVGMTSVAEAYAQASTRGAERRAARQAQQQAQQAPVEAKYPQATRSEPGLAATPRLGPKLNQLSDAYNEGNTQRTVALADEILADTRGNAYEHAIAARLAGASLIAEQPLQAITYLQRSVNLNGLNNNDHYDTVFTIAQLQAQEEQNDAAIATIDRLISEVGTGNADMYGLKGNTLYRMGRYEQALEPLTQAAQLDSRDDVTGLLMATYAELGRDGEAVTLAEQLAQRNPDDVRAQINLASIYLQAERTNDAVTVLQRLRSEGKLTEERHYRNLYAMLANTQGQERQAIEVINEGLAKGILQDGYEVQNVLGQAYYFSEQLEPAIAAWSKAAPLAPDGRVYLNLASALFNEGRMADARAAAQAALDKGLSNPEAARRIIQNSSR